MAGRRSRFHHRATAMSVVVVLQALAAVFFLADVADDLAGEGLNAHLVVEAAAALALMTAVVVGAMYVRSLLAAARADEMAVAVARGAVAQLVERRFAEWQLTPAEADVALFALKGCDAAEIAAMRGAAPGTVRAQLTRVYAKAGVNSQSGLMALFLDDVLDTAAGAGDNAMETPPA